MLVTEMNGSRACLQPVQSASVLLYTTPRLMVNGSQSARRGTAPVALLIDALTLWSSPALVIFYTPYHMCKSVLYRTYIWTLPYIYIAKSCNQVQVLLTYFIYFLNSFLIYTRVKEDTYHLLLKDIYVIDEKYEEIKVTLTCFDGCDYRNYKKLVRAIFKVTKGQSFL